MSVFLKELNGGYVEFGADTYALFMRAERICGIKALLSIKQKTRQQRKE